MMANHGEWCVTTCYCSFYQTDRNVSFFSFPFTRVSCNPITCLSGQSQHRFWHWLSTGPDHWKHADHRLLLWVLGKQRSLQELLHSLRRRFRDIVGWLEAWSPRESSHECLWVAHTLDCFISMLSSMIKQLNSLLAFERHLLDIKYRNICNHEILCSWKRIWIVNLPWLNYWLVVACMVCIQVLSLMVRMKYVHGLLDNHLQASSFNYYL